MWWIFLKTISMIHHTLLRSTTAVVSYSFCLAWWIDDFDVVVDVVPEKVQTLQSAL